MSLNMTESDRVNYATQAGETTVDNIARQRLEQIERQKRLRIVQMQGGERVVGAALDPDLAWMMGEFDEHIHGRPDFKN